MSNKIKNILIYCCIAVGVFLLLSVIFKACIEQKDNTVSYVSPVVRDSGKEKKLDSLDNVIGTLSDSIVVLNDKISRQKIKRDFIKQNLKTDYEKIENTPPDTLYIRVREYLHNWRNESTEQ